MPSTRKQKAKGRRFRQLDIMSDAENVDVMLGSYSGNVDGNDRSENEMHLDSESSRPQRNSNNTGDIPDIYMLLDLISFPQPPVCLDFITNALHECN